MPVKRTLLDKLYKNAVSHIQVDGSKMPAIRASALPFCPKKFVLSIHDFTINKYPYDFGFSFYTSIGTTMHSLLQEWIPKANPGYIFGHWLCKDCGAKVKNSLGPVECPGCGTMMDYEELEFNFTKAPISGHCDGVFVDLDFIKKSIKDTDSIATLNKIIRSKKYEIPTYILEFKSTSKNNLSYIQKPPVNYHCQASCYVEEFKYYLENNGLHSLDMRGYILKYFGRDSPTLSSKDFIELDTKRPYSVMCKLVNIYLKAIKENDIDKVFSLMPCKKAPDLFEISKCDKLEHCSNITKKEFSSIFSKVREIELNRMKKR